MTIGPDGRYPLGPLLGSGGMARVHRSRDAVLGREVAVKVLHDAAAPGTDGDLETVRARFVDEARMLAGLDHRGLVTVLDAGIDDGRPFLVLQLVDGPTLGAAVAGTGGTGLPPETVAEIGAQVADALAYTHSRAVVHRDVKPGNILLTELDSEHPRAYLTDFGIARLIDTAGEAMRHTRTGFTVGTAAYLAPEQVRGSAVGPAADVYALGLVLLECLTGRRAYEGTPVEAAVARLHNPVTVPDQLGPAWGSVLTTMTATDPADRPSASEAADMLRHLDRYDVPAVRTTVLRTTPRSAQPRRRVLVGLAAAFLLLAGTALVVRDQGADPTDSTDPRPPTAVTSSPSPTGGATREAATSPSPSPSSSPRPATVVRTTPAAKATTPVKAKPQAKPNKPQGKGQGKGKGSGKGKNKK